MRCSFVTGNQTTFGQGFSAVHWYPFVTQGLLGAIKHKQLDLESWDRLFEKGSALIQDSNLSEALIPYVEKQV